MSHFSTLVLIDKDTPEDQIEEAVRQLLAPFDEDLEVPEYMRKCDCIGGLARKKARKVAQEEHGTLEDLKAAFRKQYPCPETRDSEEANAYWEELFGSLKTTEEKVFNSHPDRDKPNPQCGFYAKDYCPDGHKVGERFEDGSGCGGTGEYLTTYNPESKWDWWVIGGRWDDKIKGDMCLVSELPDDFAPFAVVTPDGEWQERGQMGWWGCVTDEKERSDWKAEVKNLLKAHSDCLAVVVDCHI